MIVKMKEITLLVRARHQKGTLSSLRKLGVLHVRHVRPPSSEDVNRLETELERTDRALQVISPEERSAPPSAVEDASSYVDTILDLVRKKDTFSSELDELQEQHRWFERWGAVSLASLQELQAAGITVRFYVGDKRAVKSIPEDKVIQVVREEQNTVYFAFFAESADDRLEFKEELMPQVEFEALEARIAEIEKEISDIDGKLVELSAVREALLTYKTDLRKRLEFSRVLDGMGKEGEVVYLQGFCPVDALANVKSAAQEEGWAYLIQDPEDPNEVPTLIRNPKWLRIISPLFNFMGTLPGYNEHDISFWFLLFFSLFFAILIGDAGYGLVFLSLTVLAARKAKTAPREPFFLMYVLSGATILWGLISGNWFGYERIGQLPFLNMFIVEQVDSFATDNQMFMMYLCFVIGIIHLTVAHAITAFRYINSLMALAQVGWIAILWTLFFVAGSLVLQKPFPGFGLLLFVVGFLLVLVFANPQRNILKGMALSLADLPLSVISSFSDVVSYLRLFAVGYATVTVAASFNDMAQQVGFGSVLGGLIAALILFIGHSLNIALGLMAVIVHGIRLNMLEFSGHLNMQWSGRAYDPFRE